MVVIFFKYIESLFKNSKALQDVIKIFSSNILTLLLSFISSVLIARYLGVEGKGLLTVLLVYPGLIMTLSQMGIRQASVFEIGRKKFSYDKIIQNIVGLFLFMSVIGVLTCFILIRFTTDHNFSVSVIVLAALTIPLSLVNAYSGGIFLGKEKIGLSTVVGWLPPLLSLVSLVIMVLLLDMGIKGVLIATLFGNLPVALLAIYKVSQEVSIRPGFDKIILLNFLRLGSVYALAIFVNSLNYRIDIILLEKMSTAENVGLYSVGVNFAELVLQVPAAVGMVIFSRSSNAHDSKQFSRKMVKPLKYSLGIGAFLAAVIGIISPVIIPFLYSEEFGGSVPMLQLLMPGIVALVGYKMIGFDLAGKGRPWISVVSSLPGLVLNVILNFILIPEYGGKGAAIASSISYIVMAITQWFLYKNIVKKL